MMAGRESLQRELGEGLAGLNRVLFEAAVCPNEGPEEMRGQPHSGATQLRVVQRRRTPLLNRPSASSAPMLPPS
jgi:hypothetical protein